MRILKLKAEVNELAVRVGEPPRYPGGMSDEAAAPPSEKELAAPAEPPVPMPHRQAESKPP
jgi:hypothetical protein